MKEKLYKLYENSINQIDLIDTLSKAYNMLDDQKYLNWKDELNRLSIDQDRKDTFS